MGICTGHTGRMVALGLGRHRERPPTEQDIEPSSEKPRGAGQADKEATGVPGSVSRKKNKNEK